MENSEEKSLQFPCDCEEGPVGVPMWMRLFLGWQCGCGAVSAQLLRPVLSSLREAQLPGHRVPHGHVHRWHEGQRIRRI